MAPAHIVLASQQRLASRALFARPPQAARPRAASAPLGRRRPAAAAAAAAAADGLCRDKVSAPKGAPADKGDAVYTVTFLARGDAARTVSCRADQYILDAAEEAGLDLPATCRGGICGACVARVRDGAPVDQSDVDDLSFTLTEEQVAQGMSLICMGRPTGDVRLETQSDWGMNLGISEWRGASGAFEASPEPLMGRKWKEEEGAGGGDEGGPPPQ
jgi:2Fe-2S type ferredoxin